jgi:hypothetical protein
VGFEAADTVKWSEDETADVPLGVVTVISYVPVASGGEVAVMDVDEETVKEVAGVLPNMTWEAPVKLVPVNVTDVPPAVVPEVGLTAVTVGNEARV